MSIDWAALKAECIPCAPCDITIEFEDTVTTNWKENIVIH